MKMQENFKQTFDEVHAPEDLLGKVMELQMEKKEFKTRNLIKAAVCVLAVTLGVFAAGNGICYAATGESLVSKMKVVINGEEMEKEVEWTKSGEEYHGEIVIPDNDGAGITIFTVSDDIPENIYVDIERTEDDDTVEIVIEDTQDDNPSIHRLTMEDEVSANSVGDMDETE